MKEVKITPDLLKKIKEEVQLKFKDAQAEKDFNQMYENFGKSGDNKPIYDFAILWGKTMQHLVDAHGYELPVAAGETQFICDVDETVTGFTYSCALRLLADKWVYGEDLEKWHNFGYDYNVD